MSQTAATIEDLKQLLKPLIERVTKIETTQPNSQASSQADGSTTSGKTSKESRETIELRQQIEYERNLRHDRERRDILSKAASTVGLAPESIDYILKVANFTVEGDEHKISEGSETISAEDYLRKFAKTPVGMRFIQAPSISTKSPRTGLGVSPGNSTQRTSHDVFQQLAQRLRK